MKFEYYERFQKEQIREIYAYKKDPNISGEQVFWREIATGQLLEGDMVTLYNFQISPWFPRKPGLYWTYDAAKARQRAWENHVEKVDKDFVVFDVWGKTLMSELGGIGAVNLRKNRNKVIITATASGYTERGIPIICSPEIWHELKGSLNKDKMIEVDLRGTIEAIPLEYDSYFLRTPGLPKVAIHVNSILNIKVKASCLSIIVCPWTIFEMDNENYPYGFTYINHDLFSDDFDESIKWINDYIDQRNGKLILTDFDEETNSLNAKFPLNGCMDGIVFSEDIIRYCQTIRRKFSRN